MLLMILMFSSLPVWADKVVSVQDGDTITFRRIGRVRLFGIDAPENAQPFGHESKNHLTQLVLGKEVKCVKIKTNERWGRTVCILVKDGVNINEQMVKDGFAFDYRSYSHKIFQSQERRAREQGLGIWVNGGEGGELPWAYRKRIRSK